MSTTYRRSIVRFWVLAASVATCLPMAGAQTVQPPASVENAPAKPASAAPKPIAEVPFDFFANKIYLSVMVNGHGPYPLAFDTGSPTPVLDSDLAAQLEIKPGMPMAIGGTGERPVVFLSQDKSGVLASDDIAGIIGADILKKFTLILDYKRHRVIFEPNPTLPGAIDCDMSGLWLTAEGENHKTMTISDVADGSPAASADMKVGETIVSIDGRSAAESDYEKLVELFRQEGRTVKLRVKSGETERDVELVLKRRV